MLKRRLSLLPGVLLGTMLMAGNAPAASDAAPSPGDENDAAVTAAPKFAPPTPTARPAARENPYASPVRERVDTTRPAFDGRTITVGAGGDLQAAIDSAKPGDVIELEPRAVFTGTFVLPAKENPGSRWILLRTAGMQPPEGQRIDPSMHAATMAIIQSPDQSTTAAIQTASGASHYRFENLTIRAHPDPTEFQHRVYNLVSLSHSGNLKATTQPLEYLPHHIVFDRVYVYGNRKIGTRRGFAFNGRHLAVINSHVTEFKERGADSQAICGWSGPGPFRIENNFLAGAGENIMFGGGDARIENLVPSDIEIVRNHLYKPLSWREKDPAYEGTKWVVKNLLELKNGQRVLIEGNTFENNWGGQGQGGVSILFTPRSIQGKNPWAVVQDVLFQHNTMKNIAQGITIMGYDNNGPNDMPTNNITIHNNLFEDLGAFDSRAYWLYWLRTSFYTTISNNSVRFTSPEKDHGISISANRRELGELALANQVKFVDNVIEYQRYGFLSTGTKRGTETLETNFPDLDMHGNFFLQRPGDTRDLADIYPADSSFTDNTFVAAGKTFDPGEAGVNMEVLLQKQQNRQVE
jgi:hypothetical protein